MPDKTLVMTFLNEEGKKSSIRLNAVKDDLTSEQISSLMDTIIAKNVFLPTGGALKKKDSAQIVERNVSKIEVK